MRCYKSSTTSKTDWLGWKKRKMFQTKWVKIPSKNTGPPPPPFHFLSPYLSPMTQSAPEAWRHPVWQKWEQCQLMSFILPAGLFIQMWGWQRCKDNWTWKRQTADKQTGTQQCDNNSVWHWKSSHSCTGNNISLFNFLPNRCFCNILMKSKNSTFI